MVGLNRREYTKAVRIRLNQRFNICTEDGIYYAHQPIYGFRRGHSDIEQFGIQMYVRTYHIMSALSHLKFATVLDLGAAEGYKAHIARQLFQVDVYCCDLSEEACKRAREIFHIQSIAADIHDLPFRDSAFDVIVSSETLEHVADWEKAIEELLRIASKAVVITVPHDPEEAIPKNVQEATIGGHIHSFDLQSFSFLRSIGCHVRSRGIHGPLLRIAPALIEARPRRYHKNQKSRNIFRRINNACLPILRKVFGQRTQAFLIRLDDYVCRLTSSHYNGILSVILKDTTAYAKRRSSNAPAYDIMDSAVPYHYLK